jgi:hypothetical protein
MEKAKEYVAYIFSCIAIATFMAHFWSYNCVSGEVLWGVAGGCAIASIYSGIISRMFIEDKAAKGMATAAVVIGCLVLLGITLSGIFLFVPFWIG